MTYSLRIADMAAAERPRERLATQGVAALSNAELLAILLGTGQGAGQLSAVGLAQYLLGVLADGGDPLAALQQSSLSQLMAVKGVGVAKATTILAAIELGKRVYYARPTEKVAITDTSLAAAALSPDLMWQLQERFAMLMLDNRNQILGQKVISIGTATETLASPRDIFREALRAGAVKLIVAHNHPSGNTQPSESDLQLTRQLLQAAVLIDVPVLDHLILGQGTYHSIRASSTLWEPQGAV
ncbi:MAG: DNA repair protein RadC [Oscillatoriales cyanobacterium SM2_2_1]|nr:DNA repair protein RadC [Oscillatoriales cyanobacterium SM2_2_1]